MLGMQTGYWATYTIFITPLPARPWGSRWGADDYLRRHLVSLPRAARDEDGEGACY